MDDKTLTYEESDFVSVVNADGVAQPNQVPKRWLGTDLLPAGTKQATKAQAEKAETSDPNAEPAGNASRDDWAAYATNVKGASAEDLVDDQGEPLGRDALREKYGTSGS